MADPVDARLIGLGVLEEPQGREHDLHRCPTGHQMHQNRDAQGEQTHPQSGIGKGDSEWIHAYPRLRRCRYFSKATP